MTNCVSANLVWGWEVSPELGGLKERMSAMSVLEGLVGAWEPIAKEYGILLEQGGCEFDCGGSYLTLISMDDLDHSDDDISEGLADRDDATELLQDIIKQCGVLRELDKKLAVAVVEANGLAVDQSVGLMVYAVSEDAIARSHRAVGDVLVGIGMLALVDFVIVHHLQAKAMAEAGADCHTWVTSEQ